jgi:predicted CopG family antitoxin
MATKTISIDSEAYRRLRKARKHPRESFSQVIRRGHWEEKGATAQSWLESAGEVPIVEDAVMQALEAVQSDDQPPRDRWA